MSRDKGKRRLVKFTLERSRGSPSFKVILHYLAPSRKPWWKEQFLSDCQGTNTIGVYTFKPAEKRGGCDKTEEKVLCYQILDKSGEIVSKM